MHAEDQRRRRRPARPSVRGRAPMAATPPPTAARPRGERGPGTGSGWIQTHNRVRDIMAHGWRYAFQPTERLARDVGVSPRTIRRLLSGETKNPPYRLVEAVARALSRDLRRPPGYELSTREVFSPDGTYPTGSTCAVCDCDGCLPARAYDRRDRLRPEFLDAVPGEWCRYPVAPSALLSDPAMRPELQQAYK